MFGFSKNHKTIQVQFIENGSDKPFAQSSMPVEQLPDSFEVATTLHISEVDWQVDRAVPANKSEFRKTGSLRVYLYKAKTVMMAPSKLLFSLATITDDLPRLVDASLENVLVVHEDDWRQIELVSKDFDHIVREEFAAIRMIFQNHRQGSAFKTLHVRKLIPAPLAGTTLFLAELKRIFGVSHDYAGVAFSSTAAVIEHGFAFRISDATILWGKATKDGLISVLCISGYSELQFSPSMAEFQNDRRLFIVDWNNPPE